MSDKRPASQQHGMEEDTRHLARESHAMRSVVRNIVVNMESVLNDLQGIMGDIQSLVVQIDTVTDKINKQCGEPEDDSSSSSSKTSEHFVRKPQFVHGTNLCSSHSVHNPLYSSADTQKTPAESMHQPSDASSHNILQIKAFHQTSEVSALKPGGQPRPKMNEVSVNVDKYREIKMPSSSKSFSHFSKDGGGVISPSGGIAIVYPTIKGSPLTHSNNENYDTPNAGKIDTCTEKSASTKAFEGNVYLQSSSPPKRHSLAINPPHILSPRTFHDNETKDSKQMAAKQRFGITSVYNKFFQPVTPTEPRSPVISMTRRQAHTQGLMNEQLKCPNSSKPMTQNSKSYRVSFPIPEKSQFPISPSHKYCTIGGTLSRSLQPQREPSIQSQRFIPVSPLLKRSSTKAIYSKVHGSPASSRSPGSICRPGSENYYFSIESDLDSDALIENLDNRSMTPDIDWSYLNLVGNDNFQGNPARIPESPDSDHAYEIPVPPIKVIQPFQLLQTSPDVISRLSDMNIQALPTTETYIRHDSNFMFRGQSVANKIYNSPPGAHVFCCEVISFETTGYCGCYESILDSVLENVAGFESFEEACEDLDNDEVMNETYVSFEDEFQEDDWDMGMKSDDQDDYQLPFFNIQALCDYDYRLFEKLETIDDNRNIFPPSTDLNNRRCMILKSAMKGHNDIVNERNSKRRLSPVFTDADMFDDLEFPRTGENSFADDDCCALKPSITNQQPNFILQSFIPNELRLFSAGTKRGVTEYETEMSSSDDTSCQAVGTGSPMSFSSPEAALTSPDTDHFVTSSEGDDLLTSQEEAYFHMSETQDNINVSTARANMLQLRREFFESLYNVCEKREKERSQCNELKTLHEENLSFDPSFAKMDNNKDNISEAGSYQEDIASYNKNINTWTAYAIVHMQADDISDSASDIFNDNNVSCSMTSSYLDADNIATAPGNQGLTC